MASIEYKLHIAEVPCMIDIKTFIEKEPELYEELCKDYPVDKDTVYLFRIKTDELKKAKGKKKGGDN